MLRSLKLSFLIAALLSLGACRHFHQRHPMPPPDFDHGDGGPEMPGVPHGPGQPPPFNGNHQDVPPQGDYGPGNHGNDQDGMDDPNFGMLPDTVPYNPGRNNPGTPYNQQGYNRGTVPNNPNATAAEQAFIRAVKQAGGKSANGRLDPGICQVTQQYANHLASIGTLDDHAGFNQRGNKIGGNPSEVIAMFGPSTNDVQKAANKCVNQWMNSQGHHDIIVPAHDRFCYSMAKGRNGIFCVGLFSDGGGHSDPQQTVPHNRNDQNNRNGTRRGLFGRNH